MDRWINVHLHRIKEALVYGDWFNGDHIIGGAGFEHRIGSSGHAAEASRGAKAASSFVLLDP